MKNKEILLICKRVIYYVQNDEDAFFEWIKKVKLARLKSRGFAII